MVFFPNLGCITAQPIVSEVFPGYKNHSSHPQGTVFIFEQSAMHIVSYVLCGTSSFLLKTNATLPAPKPWERKLLKKPKKSQRKTKQNPPKERQRMRTLRVPLLSLLSQMQKQRPSWLQRQNQDWTNQLLLRLVANRATKLKRNLRRKKYQEVSEQKIEK